MSIRARFVRRNIIVAVLAVVAGGLLAGLAPTVDASLHAGYARRLAGRSARQQVVLVAVDATTLAAWGAPPWGADRQDALAAAIEQGAPRLVIWPSEQVPGDSSAAPLGVAPIAGATLVRAADPSFPALALAALGAPSRTEPLPVSFTARLPTVPALRVVGGEIPASIFRDRVVMIGRSDAAVVTVATPLGPMSPTQVEAHALLGVLDGAVWAVVPGWLRLVALGLWALALVTALRGRGVAAALTIVAGASAAVVVLDAGLFAAGLLRLGVATPLLVALAAGAWRVTGATGIFAPASARRRLDDASASSRVSGLRVSYDSSVDVLRWSHADIARATCEPASASASPAKRATTR